MASFSTDDIVRATGCELVVDGAATVTHAVIDSRAAAPGALFVAFAGERTDGNAYAAAAAEAGCACVCVSAAPDARTVRAARERGCALVRAAGDDGEEFLMRLAASWRRANPQWLVVGVTGSVGKTTTKDMLAAGIAVARRVHATAGNLNNRIGLPLTLLGASAEDEVIVAEMGMNSAGELAGLAACARPDVALITNVGTSHIGMLGSREAIARAKAEIVGGMRPAAESPASCLIMGSDNAYADLIESEYAAPAGVEVVRVGAPGSPLWAEGVSLDERGRPRLTLCLPDGWRRELRLAVPGRHVVGDLVLALEAARRVGVDLAAAADAVAAMPQPHMRLELLDAPGGARVIDDSYNASPDSVAAALDVLCSQPCSRRRVAVLGEMGELGAESARLHGYVGAYAAAKSLDLLVLVGTGDASRVAQAALTMGLPPGRLATYATVEEATAALAPTLAAGDVVLAKGSRAVGLDAFVRGVMGHAG